MVRGVNTMQNTILNILVKFMQRGYKQRACRVNTLRRHVILHQNFSDLKAQNLPCPFQSYIVDSQTIDKNSYPPLRNKNAGGITLHSFFQLPFGPYVPDSDLPQWGFSKKKIYIIRSLYLLVIDEFSMVRADVLDRVEAVLRRYKHRHRPFGGLQLLMIGDLHQLSPQEYFLQCQRY